MLAFLSSFKALSAHKISRNTKISRNNCKQNSPFPTTTAIIFFAKNDQAAAFRTFKSEHFFIVLPSIARLSEKNAVFGFSAERFLPISRKKDKRDFLRCFCKNVQFFLTQPPLTSAFVRLFYRLELTQNAATYCVLLRKAFSPSRNFQL